MGGRLVVLGVKVIAWLKLPVMLLMAVVIVTPPHSVITQQAALLGASEDRIAMVYSNSLRDEQRQQDMNESDIKSLQRRLDLLEAMRIDASISGIKATIDYDHALLMTIAGALLLMLVGNVLGYFKNKRTGEL